MATRRSPASASLFAMGVSDDNSAVERYFDELGEKEWDRLEIDLRSRVSLETHHRFLRRWIAPETRVLEIGAGPGRFTIELARMGCRVVVSDISGVQLELNRRYVGDAGLSDRVECWRNLDVRYLSEIATGSFDAVLANGGPLSYVFQDAPRGLAECLRVVVPGGPVVASVMSLTGKRSVLPGQLPGDYPLRGTRDIRTLPRGR